MLIQPISAENYAEWRVLWQGFLDFHDVALDEEVTASVWKRLLDNDNPLKGLVAIDQGKVIGFTHFYFHGASWNTAPYCYLEDLYVDQTVRSKGTGRALVDGVKEAARKRGASKLYWHTNADNKNAQAFYDKIATLTDYVRYDLKL